jgi:malonyl-CoA O-methyltransferase
MVEIDRNRIKRSFDRHALEYDVYARVQKRVVAGFAGFLRGWPDTPRRVLDIGSGTGMLLKELAVLYPAAKFVGLDLASGMSLKARANLAATASIRLMTGDAEALPFRENAFDLVVSTSTFQWLESLDRVFADAFRVLAPNGRFVFALFGGRTLFELRGAYRSAWEKSGRGPEDRTHDFHSAFEVEAALGRAGFADPLVFAELEIEYHFDVPALLRSLRRIGAGNSAPLGRRGLAERRVMLDMMDIYQHDYAVDGLIPATYEVIYGEAGKAGSGSGSGSEKTFTQPEP